MAHVFFLICSEIILLLCKAKVPNHVLFLTWYLILIKLIVINKNEFYLLRCMQESILGHKKPEPQSDPVHRESQNLQ
jgi:hypothetical protein